MKFGICNEMYLNLSIFEVIDHAAKLGYHGVELAPFTLTEDVASFPVEEQRRIAGYAHDKGIAIAGMHWLFVTPKGLHLTSADKSVRRRTLDFFRKLMEIGVNTGGRILTLGSPAQRSYSRGETEAEAFKRTVDFFAELASELESLELLVCLEPLEDDVTNFITSTSSAERIVKAIGSPSMGVTLDTHFLRWEAEKHSISAADAFRIAGSSLGHLHIQDDNSRAPGTGNADFTEFIAAVKEIGWQGYISMETFAGEKAGEGEKMAAAGISFLKEHFS